VSDFDDHGPCKQEIEVGTKGEYNKNNIFCKKKERFG
jgi:hypothetical protein